SPASGRRMTGWVLREAGLTAGSAPCCACRSWSVTSESGLFGYGWRRPRGATAPREKANRIATGYSRRFANAAQDESYRVCRRLQPVGGLEHDERESGPEGL